MSPYLQTIRDNLDKRYRKERRFQWYGRIAISIGLLFLGFLLLITIGNAYTALKQTYIGLEIELTEDDFDNDLSASSISKASYGRIIKRSLREAFPDVTKRKAKKELYGLVSGSAEYDLRDQVIENPSFIGTKQTYWLLADDEVDVFMKGRIDRTIDEGSRRIKDSTLGWIDTLKEQGLIRKQFNAPLFSNGDSRDPEQAGIRGAIMLSLIHI